MAKAKTQSTQIASIDREDSVGDWGYYLCRLTDDRWAMIWVGAESPWDTDGHLTCPIHPDAPGDKTGAQIFEDRDTAAYAYKDMLELAQPQPEG
jgi:hypothetical protein